MKQVEKSQKSREHILEYAFAEFAEQGYLGASVNTICTAGSISKGLLYHYYADKDALYLVSTYLKNAGLEQQQADKHNQLCRRTFHTMLYGLIARS